MMGKSTVSARKLDTLIGRNTIFEGTLKSEASIRIEGQLIGDIECKGDVFIGEKGLVQSNITARNITVCGTIKGNVVTSNKLTIHWTGKLLGDHQSTSIHIEQGGLIVGKRHSIKPNEPT